jgi:cobalt/nickel transport system permease protein
LSFAHYLDVGQMDDLGRLDSPVHRLDARVKALTTAGFIVAVMSFPRYEVSALMPFFLYPAALLTLGRIPPGCILRKVLVAMPFALAVGILNPWLDRRLVMTLGGHGIAGGWLSLLSIAVRSALTVSAALTLVACTGIYRLCAGLEQLGLPRVFAVQVQLLYRYLFVVADEALRMRRAAEMRSPGRPALSLRTYAALVGNLLLRSLDRAQRIYQAMVARGFTGHLRVLRPTRIRAADLAFLAGWTAFFVTARCWNISRWLGALLTGDGA